jgi:hypothetical protein
MPIRVDAYTAGGVATGAVTRPGSIRDALEGASQLEIGAAVWLPLDGSPERNAGDVALTIDDILFVVAHEVSEAPVHAQWHDIELDAGPYRRRGEMPTMPGFDPGRALARPTGEFVLLRDARIELIDQPDAGEATSAEILVNRYLVDRVVADLMLGFFFPGAASIVTGHVAGPELPNLPPDAASDPAGAPAPASDAATA